MPTTTDQPDMMAQISTGVVGLDRILKGGLRENHLYLLQGNSGCGKTTLGLQFVLEGANNDESSLYVTLSETKRELTHIAHSHGWSLERVHLHELSASMINRQIAANQTVFSYEEVELVEVTDEIIELIETIKPQRLVIDSVSDIRILATSPLSYRRQILKLCHALSQLDCTAILISNEIEDNAMTLNSVVHGVIQFEKHSRDYGYMRRRLQVPKMRGLSFQSGYHDFRIETGGLAVYPRMETQAHRGDESWEVASSGIPALDDLLGGGLMAGTACLLAGQSGTGKTTLSMHYVAEAAKRGEKAAVFLFDERLETFYRRAETLNMDIRPFVSQDLLELRQINAGEISPGEFAHLLENAVNDGAKLVVIDSLSGYLIAMPQERLLLTQMHELMTYLSQRGVLTLLIATQHGLLNTSPSNGTIDISYLADSVMLLRHFEANGSIKKTIAVIKKRHGQHEKTIRQLKITSKGIEISAPLPGFRDVLSTSPSYKGDPDVLIQPEKGDDT